MGPPEAKTFSWLHHPMVLAYKNRRVTGDPDQEWFSWVKREFAPEGLPRGLSLGCGLGVVERKAIGTGLCRLLDAFDISPEAVRGAAALVIDKSFRNNFNKLPSQKERNT